MCVTMALRPINPTSHTSHHLITLCGSMCMLHSFIAPTSTSPWSVALSLPPVLHLWLHQHRLSNCLLPFPPPLRNSPLRCTPHASSCARRP